MGKSCVVTPDLSLSMRCSDSCSFPVVLQCPQAVLCSVWRVQLTTFTRGTIQWTNESQPRLRIEMQSFCCNSSTNMNNNHFSNYFSPFLFQYGSYVFLEGMPCMKRLFKFLSLGLFSEMQLLKRMDFRWSFCAVDAVPQLLQHHWTRISERPSLTWRDDVSCWGWIQLWLGPMATQLLHCPMTAWCSLVCQREEMGLYFPEAPSPFVVFVPVCC